MNRLCRLVIGLGLATVVVAGCSDAREARTEIGFHPAHEIARIPLEI